ncbi:MAG: hypothetical protein U1D06_04840, partial [Paracoccaceae bacterium]|nr:hypothetical protein [Paracoccaceae bacterium]
MTLPHVSSRRFQSKRYAIGQAVFPKAAWFFSDTVRGTDTHPDPSDATHIDEAFLDPYVTVPSGKTK